MMAQYSEKNTFIEFPAPRSESLEEFLQPKSAFSCPVSRMVSLEEDPRENTDSLMQWPATRGPSLDDEEEAGKFASEVNAALWNAFNPLPSSAASQFPPASQAPPRWASIEDDEDLPVFMKTMAKEETGNAQTFE